jgi:hypothetical protein
MLLFSVEYSLFPRSGMRVNDPMTPRQQRDTPRYARLNQGDVPDYILGFPWF